MSQALTQERLKQLLHYDPETGVFTWRVRKGSVKPGDLAGARRKDGYGALRVDGTLYLSHRLAWLYVNGQWPVEDLDHRDLDKSNTKISNLRECSPLQNMQNLPKPTTNTTGFMGVTRHVRGGLFKAQIYVGGVNKHLGLFPTAAEAHKAYLAAKHVFHPFFSGGDQCATT